ncbi:MAG: hypothetical protein IJD54_03705 [Clostridia bacterium]|nr:hypothetical protein [Clostridia bacterium]
MFCHKCGREVADDAYICVGCGCIVGEKQNTEKEGFLERRSFNWNKIASIGLIAFYFCLAIFFIFFGIGVADLYSSGYSRADYGFGYNISVDVYMRMDYAIGMLISSIFAYISSIVALVFGIKGKDLNTRNSCIICYILANSIFIVAVFAMALCY